jgi:hypothetical protein
VFNSDYTGAELFRGASTGQLSYKFSTKLLTFHINVSRIHGAVTQPGLDSPCGDYFDPGNLENHGEGIEYTSSFRLDV